MLLKDVLGCDDKHSYKFTQYVEELAAMLNDGIGTLVLCNLLNTLCGYGSLTPKTLNGKEYHFYRSKENICSDELYINVQQYNRAVKRLKDKGLIKTFQGRNPKEKMRKISYFYINIEAVRKLYLDGYSLRNPHKNQGDILTPDNPNKESVKKPQKPKSASANTNPKLAQLEKDLVCGYISKELYEYKKSSVLNKSVIK
jgi:hypothetical protein